MASRPVTRTGTSSSRQADSTASTIAEPDMSVFMPSMPSAGLTCRPPVSNVMPLPTSTTRGVDAVAPAGSWSSRTSRGGVAEPWPTARMPPKPSARSRRSSHTWASRPVRRATVRAWRASQAGFLVFDGVAASPRATSWARARTTARCTTTASPVPVTTAVAAGSQPATAPSRVQRGDAQEASTTDST